MVLKVVGKRPTLTPESQRSAVQRVVVEFNPLYHSVVINQDVDVVTLGITLAVLQDAYDKALEYVPPELAQKIRTTVLEVLKENEGY